MRIPIQLYRINHFLYTCILRLAIQEPTYQAFWCKVFNKHINFTNVYTNKISKICDMQKAETNFEMYTFYHVVKT